MLLSCRRKSPHWKSGRQPCRTSRCYPGSSPLACKPSSSPVAIIMDPVSHGSAVPFLASFHKSDCHGSFLARRPLPSLWFPCAFYRAPVQGESDSGGAQGTDQSQDQTHWCQEGSPTAQVKGGCSSSQIPCDARQDYGCKHQPRCCILCQSNVDPHTLLPQNSQFLPPP